MPPPLLAFDLNPLGKMLTEHGNPLSMVPYWNDKLSCYFTITHVRRIEPCAKRYASAGLRCMLRSQLAELGTGKRGTMEHKTETRLPNVA